MAVASAGGPAAAGDEAGDALHGLDEDVADGMLAQLQKYSLKLEDVAHQHASTRKIRFQAPLRPAKKARPQLSKTYSQYNLEHLDGEAQDQKGSARKPSLLHGVLGLVVRNIDVTPGCWDTTVTRASGLHRRSIFGLPLLHPYTRVSVAWRLAMLLFDATFTAFWVPLSVGFCSAAYGNLSYPCTRADFAGGIIYIINLLVGFSMGTVVACDGKRAVLMDGPSVGWVYIMYGKFLMDSLATVPFFVLIATMASPDAPSSERRLLSLLSLLRLVRMLRLVNLVKVVYKEPMSGGQHHMSWITQHISVNIMYLLILCYQLAVTVNLVCSVLVFLASYYGYYNTWFDALPWVDFSSIGDVQLWYEGVYYVVTALTTTGQGQAPRRVSEQITVSFAMVYGMVFNGLVVGVVGRALMQASGDASAMYLSRKKVGLVSSWARLRHLPGSLIKELQVYFADSELARRDFNFEASVIEGLPSTLRRSVVGHIVRPLVDKVHILSQCDPELLDMLAAMFRPTDVPPGHDLCRQGGEADRLWLVETGDVVALRHKEKDAHPTTGMVCLLGEGVLLRGLMEVAAVRPWTLRTTKACRLWELHWDDLEPLLRVYPRLISITLQYIRDRLIRVLDAIPQRDTAWAELVALLARITKQPHLLDAAADNLKDLVQAREEDASLPSLLAAWLESGIATSLELGGTGGQRRGLVTMSIMIARQSRDALGPPSMPLGTTSWASGRLATNSRFPDGGGGGGGDAHGGSLAAPSVGFGALLPGGSTVPPPPPPPRLPPPLPSAVSAAQLLRRASSTGAGTGGAGAAGGGASGGMRTASAELDGELDELLPAGSGPLPPMPAPSLAGSSRAATAVGVPGSPAREAELMQRPLRRRSRTADGMSYKSSATATAAAAQEGPAGAAAAGAASAGKYEVTSPFAAYARSPLWRGAAGPSGGGAASAAAGAGGSGGSGGGGGGGGAAAASAAGALLRGAASFGGASASSGDGAAIAAAAVIDVVDASSESDAGGGSTGVVAAHTSADVLTQRRAQSFSAGSRTAPAPFMRRPALPSRFAVAAAREGPWVHAQASARRMSSGDIPVAEASPDDGGSGGDIVAPRGSPSTAPPRRSFSDDGTRPSTNRRSGDHRGPWLSSKRVTPAAASPGPASSTAAAAAAAATPVAVGARAAAAAPGRVGGVASVEARAALYGGLSAGATSAEAAAVAYEQAGPHAQPLHRTSVGERLSLIANTPRAFNLVDAGGVPHRPRPPPLATTATTAAGGGGDGAGGTPPGSPRGPQGPRRAARHSVGPMGSPFSSLEAMREGNVSRMRAPSGPLQQQQHVMHAVAEEEGTALQHRWSTGATVAASAGAAEDAAPGYGGGDGGALSGDSAQGHARGLPPLAAMLHRRASTDAQLPALDEEGALRGGLGGDGSGGGGGGAAAAATEGSVALALQRMRERANTGGAGVGGAPVWGRAQTLGRADARLGAAGGGGGSGAELTSPLRKATRELWPAPSVGRTSVTPRPSLPGGGSGGAGGSGAAALSPRPHGSGAVAGAGGGGGSGGGGGGPEAACAGPTVCATCGRCTCAACRERALAAAAAVEAGAGRVVAPPPPPPGAAGAGMGPHGFAHARATVGTGAMRLAGPRASLDLAAVAAVAAHASQGWGANVLAAAVPGLGRHAQLASPVGGRPAAGAGAGTAPPPPWGTVPSAAAAAGAAAGGGAAAARRRPETWRLRNQSTVARELGAPSIVLAPYY